jgi:hypothetical protein
VKELKLSCGRVALVDDDVFEQVKDFTWCSWARPGMRTRYAMCGRMFGKPARLHRVVLGVTDPKVEIDHINGDGLDNRRENLRVSDRTGNNCNKPAYLSSKSGIKGVHWSAKCNSWIAQIQFNKVKYALGHFPTKEDAAAAYDRAAVALHGSFANPNEIQGDVGKRQKRNKMTRHAETVRMLRALGATVADVASWVELSTSSVYEIVGGRV